LPNLIRAHLGFNLRPLCTQTIGMVVLPAFLFAAFASGCGAQRSPSLNTPLFLPKDRLVKILSHQQVTFPVVDHPGNQLVLAEFRVTFRDLKTFKTHTCIIEDVISSAPSGPVPIIETEGQEIEYGRLCYWR